MAIEVSQLEGDMTHNTARSNFNFISGKYTVNCAVFIPHLKSCFNLFILCLVPEYSLIVLLSLVYLV